MKGPRWVLPAILLLGPGPHLLHAQEGAPPFPGLRGLALGIEVFWHFQADEMVAPHRYSGRVVGPAILAGLSSSSGIRSLELSYGQARLTTSVTRVGRHVEEGHRLDLRLLVLQKIASLRGGSFEIFLGGALAGNGALYDHWYTRDDSEPWLHFFGTLQPGLGWSARLPGGGMLWQEATVPLLGIAVRPRYQGLTDGPRTRWAGPRELEGIQQHLRFQQAWGGRVRLGLVYSYLGLRYPHPRPVSWSRQGLGLYVTLWSGGGG